MANPQIENELAACFDLLKVSLGKSDAVRSKSDALKSLVKAAVERGVEANELIGDPMQISAAVITTLRYLAGGLPVNGEQRSDMGMVIKPYLSVSKKYTQTSSEQSHSETPVAAKSASHDLSEGSSSGLPRSANSASSAPDQTRLEFVNRILGDLGLPAIKTKSDVNKIAAANIKRLCARVQEFVDHDATTEESVDFLEDYVMVDGAFKHSKSGTATAADLKDGLRAFLTA